MFTFKLNSVYNKRIVTSHFMLSTEKLHDQTQILRIQKWNQSLSYETSDLFIALPGYRLATITDPSFVCFLHYFPLLAMNI